MAAFVCFENSERAEFTPSPTQQQSGVARGLALPIAHFKITAVTFCSGCSVITFCSGFFSVGGKRLQGTLIKAKKKEQAYML